MRLLDVESFYQSLLDAGYEFLIHHLQWLLLKLVVWPHVQMGSSNGQGRLCASKPWPATTQPGRGERALAYKHLTPPPNKRV